MLVNVLGGEAEFFVEDLVRSGETEALETPDSAVFANETFERARQAGCHTETFDTLRQHLVLIFLILLTEETFTRYADYLQADTFCAEQFSTGKEG